MKKSILKCLMAISLGVISQPIIAQSKLPSTLYVSPSGNDQGKGNLENPVKSLKEALKRKSTEPEAISQIILREGTYYFTETLSLQEAHSGELGQPLLIKPYANEEVIFSGGIDIPLDEIKLVKDRKILKRLPKEANGKVYEVALEKYNIEFGAYGPRGFNRPYGPAPNELFINGKAQQISRWPNLGEENIKIGEVLDEGSVPRNGDFSNRGAEFKWNTERPKRWKNAKNLYLSGFFQHGYADDAIQVEKIDYKKETFKMIGPHLYGVGNKHVFNTWFAINLLEEIDLPGEYYFDEDSQKLYFYPPTGIDEIKKLQISTLKSPFLSFQDASFITLDGILMENGRDMGVYIHGGESIIIKNSTFKNLGTVAINIGKGIEVDTLNQHAFSGKPKENIIGSLYSHLYNNTTLNRDGGKNHLIESCDIFDMGAGGIILGGGDKKSLTPSNNQVNNCHIYDFNRLDRTYKSAINIDGVGNVISHNLIHDAPGTAILLRGNNHIIEYNEVHHVMMDGDDQGAYYLGRDPSEFNNVVRYNYFHNIGISPTTHSTWTIYYDDGSCGNIAYGNVFRKAGKGGVFLIGGGKYNKVFNNVFVDNSLVFHIDARNTNWSKFVLEPGGIYEQRLNAINNTMPPYSAFYPQLKNYWNDHPELPSNEIINNLFFNNKKLLDHEFETTTWEGNWDAPENPGFEDMENLNFQLKADAPVFDNIEGFDPVPFNKMGLQTTTFRKTIKGEDGRIHPLD